MADKLFVDQTNDNNYANNGKGDNRFPYFSVEAARLDSSPSDEIIIQNSSDTDPARSVSAFDSNLTFNSGSGTFNLTCCEDVSEGGRWCRHQLETHCQTLTEGGWAVANGTITNNTDQLYGDFCNDLVSVGTPLFRRNWTWGNTDKQRFLVVYKCASSTDILEWGARANTTEWYDSGDTDTWVTGEKWIALPNSTSYSVFITPEIPVNSSPVGTSFMNFRTQSGNRVFIQYVCPIVDNITWTLDSGATYFINYAEPAGAFLLASANPILYKSTQAQWNQTAHEALRIVPEGPSVVGLSDGEQFYDSTALRLYYKLAAGEADITALHLETVQAPNPLKFDDGCDGATVNNAITWGGEQNIVMDGLITDSIVINSSFSGVSTIAGVRAQGVGTMTLNNHNDEGPVASAINKEYGQGYLVGVALNAEQPTMILNDCKSKFAGDDGAQSIGAGNLTINGFCCEDPEANGVEISNDFAGGSTVIIKRFANKGGTQNAYRDQAQDAVNITLDDCDFYADGSTDIERTTANATYVAVTDIRGGSTGGTIPAILSDNTTIFDPPVYYLPCFSEDSRIRKLLHQAPNTNTRASQGRQLGNGGKHQSPLVKTR